MGELRPGEGNRVAAGLVGRGVPAGEGLSRAGSVGGADGGARRWGRGPDGAGAAGWVLVVRGDAEEVLARGGDELMAEGRADLGRAGVVVHFDSVSVGIEQPELRVEPGPGSGVDGGCAERGRAADPDLEQIDAAD